MFINGYIYKSTTTSSYIDSTTGELVSSEQSWDAGAPCCITTNSDTRRGVYDDGEFRQASYTVIIEMNGKHYSAETVKLERNGEELGEFRVLSIEPITTMGRVKIVV